MANYAELLLASENDTLRNKVRVACIIAAEAIRTEDAGTANHANRVAWAKTVFANPNSEAERMLWAVLAQNKNAALAEITGATDASVQTAVNAAVDVFAT
jgi:hypothetical protein